MSILTTIARPYAKAAFEDAVQHDDIAAWSELLLLAGKIVDQPVMKQFLQDPRITPKECYETLSEFCKPVLQERQRNFLELLADNKRLVCLPDIEELFTKLRIEREKTSHVTIISAYPLVADEEKQLEKALKIRLQKDVVLECKVDPTILGGIVIRAGDLVIDNSVRGKLARLESVLTS